MLNERQREAAESENHCIVTLAGPGTGKTSTLTQRIAYLINKREVRPHRILAVTFTNKAADEMRERIASLVGVDTAKHLTVRTFHSFCIRLLRYESKELAGLLKPHFGSAEVGAKFSIYDTKMSEAIIRKILKEKKSELRPADVLNAISGMKGKVRLPDDVRDPALRDLYQEYQSALVARNGMDFADMIMYTVMLFEQRPEIARKYQSRFKFIHIDEFQDTNQAQLRLTLALKGNGNNLFVVGDDDQSIYGFRGASPVNLRGLFERFPDHHRVTLEQNYRTRHDVFTLSQTLIANNIYRERKNLWTAREDGVVNVWDFPDDRDEAQEVAREIKLQHELGTPLKEMAVLYRTNAMSRAIETALLEMEIPYIMAKGTQFYDRMEIRHALAYLRVVHSGNIDSLARIINVPARRIGKKSAEKVMGAIKGADALDWLVSNTIPLSGQAAASLTRIAHHLEGLRSRPLPEVMASIVSILSPEINKTDNPDDRMANLDELVGLSYKYDNLTDFLDHVGLISATDVEASEDSVNLATFHASKGLEWDHVYIIGSEEGLCPHYMSEDIEEERRLFYVGMTRAKNHLTISHSECRYTNGNYNYNARSRFVDEISLED